MSVLGNSLLLGAAAAGPTAYQVSRSLRFNASDSAFCSRVVSSAGNRKTWTWSAWVKRTKSSSGATYQSIFTAGIDGNNNSGILFDNSDRLEIWNVVGNVNVTQKITSQVFRDFSGWYHFVVSATSSTLSLYVNGVEVTAWATNNQPGNEDWSFNAATTHYLARYWDGSSSFPGDFYLADVHFIDGQALTPSSFAETDATTGQWIPKLYSGSYGTNGFKLTFSDNSAATAAALGKDTSGNGNNWTPNNLSVTAGAGNDSLVDTPTSYGTDTGAGGEVRGNYCTLSPITTSGMGLATLANGNLDVSGTGASYTGCVSTIAMSSGKWYWEQTISSTGTRSDAGIVSTDTLASAIGGNAGYGDSVFGWTRGTGGQLSNSGNNIVAGLSTLTANDVMGVAFDADTGKLWFSKNGVWDSSGNPATGANPSVTATVSGKSYFALAQGYGTWSRSMNFGQRPFAYTAPSGFKALCDTNLTAPVVAKPNTVMDVKLYTGNGSSQTISGLGFSPDLVWIKERSGTGAGDAWHALFDSVRGNTKALYSNDTNAETTGTAFTSFDSLGFTVGLDTSQARANDNNDAYVAWTWDAGTTTSSNGSGSITSSVRVNATAGFSIVTYTGTGSNATVGHGLGAGVGMLIIKNRNSANEWVVGHTGITLGSGRLYLNTTDANDTAGASALWNSTAATSSVFSVGTNSKVNSSGGTYVAYVFSPVAGYSSFGSYTGNGSSDGPFVYTGFRPRWVMTKSTSTTGYWTINDTARSSYNAAKENLWANASLAEDATTNGLDILSNGFKPRDASNYNGSGVSYVYIAFAESPFQYARAR